MIKIFIVKFFQRSFEVNEGSTCVKFWFHFEVILWKSGFGISKYSNLERTRIFHPSRDCDNFWHICSDDQFLNWNLVGIKHKYILYLVNHFTNLSNGTLLMFLDAQLLDSPFIYSLSTAFSSIHHWLITSKYLFRDKSISIHHQDSFTQTIIYELYNYYNYRPIYIDKILIINLPG